jgi:hypothetical protein
MNEELENQEELLEETDETLMWWDFQGLGSFMHKLRKLGYELDYLTWDTLDVLHRYIVETKVSHTSKEESEMERFVACYIYLGYVLNHKYKTKWIRVNDGTADMGMFAVANQLNKDPELYFVPRGAIVSVILGRVPEGLKEYMRETFEDEYVSVVENLQPEDEA